MEERDRARRAALPANPRTQRLFRRQVWLQVYLPLLVALAGLVGLVAVLSLQRLGDVSVWADASLVLMAVPTCVVGLVLLVAAGAAAFGVMRLIGVIPPYTYRIQQGLAEVARRVDSAADAGARPLVAIESVGASARTVVDWLRWQVGRLRRG